MGREGGSEGKGREGGEVTCGPFVFGDWLEELVFFVFQLVLLEDGFLVSLRELLHSLLHEFLFSFAFDLRLLQLIFVPLLLEDVSPYEGFLA